MPTFLKNTLSPSSPKSWHLPKSPQDTKTQKNILVPYFLKSCIHIILLRPNKNSERLWKGEESGRTAVTTARLIQAEPKTAHTGKQFLGTHQTNANVYTKQTPAVMPTSTCYHLFRWHFRCFRYIPASNTPPPSPSVTVSSIMLGVITNHFTGVEFCQAQHFRYLWKSCACVLQEGVQICLHEVIQCRPGLFSASCQKAVTTNKKL